MVSVEERLSKTGTPSLASTIPKGHYNPDIVFLSSEPTIKVPLTIKSRALLAQQSIYLRFYDT